MYIFYSTLILSVLVINTLAGELRCLRPGAVVLSLYKDSRYFPGRVESLGDSIDVTFDNGKQQSYTSYGNDVIVDDVPDVTELMGGARVLARRPNSISFEPGFVNGTIEGLNDTFLVNYDSGDSIARTIDEIRLATKPNNCMNEKGIYIGCFENYYNNDLTNYYPVNPTDVATCNWACFARGFNFAGLQNGTWCFCGNHVNDSMRADDNECNIACRDSREDVCGGYKRMTVYWTGADSPKNLTNEDQMNVAEIESSDSLKETELSSVNDCSDIYDSTQCNAWADAERCIHDPDWMIANCKKSCYACSYNEHDSTTDNYSPAAQPDVAQPVYPTQPSAYQQPSNQYQSPNNYQYYQSTNGQSYYPAYSEAGTTKKSEHPTSSTSNSAGYLGCYTDSSPNHDLEYLADLKPVSIRSCITKCKSMRFPYAGLQSSSSCYCGLHYGKYGQVAHEDCNTPCEADSSEMCGGPFKNSLYNTGFSSTVKNTENAFTRKTVPSLPSRNDIVSRSLLTSPSTSNYHSPQAPFQQQTNNMNYNPSVYNQQRSSYQSSPSYSTYNQATYPQRNYASAPSSSFNTQAGTSQSLPSGYNPKDSSSYGWRESYVKLREKEQARSAQIIKNRLRKSKKTGKVSISTYSEDLKSTNRRKPQKSSQSFAKIKKKLHKSKLFKEWVRYRKSHSRNALKSHRKTAKTHDRVSHISRQQKDFRIHEKASEKKTAKMKEDQKNLGKPGVFLRKRASKKNSFLAFLPHEVTKNEELLGNVYHMLSVMIKKLRKQRMVSKNPHSMKTLKKYLKIPGNLDKNARKRPMMSRKIIKTERKVKKLRLSNTSKGTQRFPANGQKQLSKAFKGQPNSQSGSSISVTHVLHRQGSHNLSNHSLPFAGKPSYVYRVIVRPESPSSNDAVTSSLLNNSKIGLHVFHHFQNASSLEIPAKNTFQSSLNPRISPQKPTFSVQNPTNTTVTLTQPNLSVTPRNPLGSSRGASATQLSQSETQKSTSENHEGGKFMRLDSHHDQSVSHRNWSKVGQKVSETHRKKWSKVVRNKKPQKSRYYSNSFKKITLKHESNINSENHKNLNKHRKRVHKHGNESMKHLDTPKKTKEIKHILKVDTSLAKEIKTNGTNEIFVEKSDEDIISTIVNLLEAEKRKRQQYGSKFKKVKKVGRLSSKTSVQNVSGTRIKNLIEKKDNISHVPDNLMKEEEYFKKYEERS